MSKPSLLLMQDEPSVTHPLPVLLIHWLTVALVMVVAVAILGRELVEERSLRLALLSLHRGAGLAVLAVTLLRITISPVIVHGRATLAKSWHQTVAMLTHLLLYAALIVNPLLGWALSSARGQVAYFLGFIALPALGGKDRDFADSLQSLHTMVAMVLLAIVTLHSSAALWHHFVRRDAVLKKMLPPPRAAAADRRLFRKM